MNKPVKVGIIGGSGVANLDFIEDVKEISGKHEGISDSISAGTLQSTQVAFLPRHGRHLEVPPSKVPYHENILALKGIGCSHIIATTSVLSLELKFKPGDFVVLTSFIDCTDRQFMTTYRQAEHNNRTLTPMFHRSPFSRGLSSIIKAKASDLGIPCHPRGVVATIDTPQCSEILSDHRYFNSGANFVNFTTVPEVFLANEMRIPYATIAMVADYDPFAIIVGKPQVDKVKILHSNTDKIMRLLQAVVPEVQTMDWTNELRELYEGGRGFW